MASAETEALTKAIRANGSVDLETYHAEYRRGSTERQERVRRDAQAILRAIDGWTNVETAQDWDRIVHQADEDLQSGTFLVERLGGQRYLDPTLVAALSILRRQLISDHGADTAAELMMIDSTLMAYAHQLRITRWIGDLAASIEAELFGQATLDARLDHRHGKGMTVRGLAVEELVQRLSEQLMPLIDRSNRMLLRNLKALKEHRRAPAPSVSIGQAQQVNVGNQQLNLADDRG